jgi:hypothetical protein
MQVRSEDGESTKSKGQKTVPTIQAPSGCCLPVFSSHFPSYNIPDYIHSDSYVTVDVADAARTADRSLLTDPPSSNVIAAICLTAKKVSYPHEIIVGPALVGRPSVTLSTLLWMVDSSWSKIEQMLAPCLVDVRIAGSACIYFRPLAGPTGA